MSRPRGYPTLRRHRTHRVGVVRLSGVDYYLGAWPNADRCPHAVKEAYDRKIGEWLARGCTPELDPNSVTVSHVLARYLAHCEIHYRKTYANGVANTSQFRIRKSALASVVLLYGPTKAVKFDRHALRNCRNHLISTGLGRTTINLYVAYIKQCFKWASAEEGLIPALVYAELRLLPALAADRSAAPDYPDVTAPPDEHVELALSYLDPDIRTMARIQRL